MIYILGSISAGKTTLTKMLAEELKVPYYLEDIDNGLVSNMLQTFYHAGADSRKQVSAMLQVAFLTVRYKQLKKAVTQHNALLDSNLLSDYLMASNLYRRGEMDESSYNVYLALNNEMQSNVNGTPDTAYPDLIIYLDIDPQHEIEEIQKRGRGMEDISKDSGLVDYYNSVNKTYKDWYQGHPQAQVIRIDRDKYDFVNSEADRNTVFDMIEDKMGQVGLLEPKEVSSLKNAHKVVEGQAELFLGGIDLDTIGKM